jgi:putative transcriptional regulator
MTDAAEGLNRIGLMSDDRLDEIKTISIPKLRPYSADDVKILRQKFKLTQTLFAKCIHVSPSLVKKWEQGLRHPRGSNLLTLHIVEKQGLKTLLNL